MPSHCSPDIDMMQTTFRFARPPPKVSFPRTAKLLLQIQRYSRTRFLPTLELWKAPASLKINWARNGIPHLEWTGNLYVHARDEYLDESKMSAAVPRYEERGSAVAEWDQYPNLKDPQSDSCFLIILNHPFGQVPLATIECRSAGLRNWRFQLRDVEGCQFKWERRQSPAQHKGDTGTFVLQYTSPESKAGLEIATISNGSLCFPAGIEAIMDSVQRNRKNDSIEQITDEAWMYTHICLMTAWTIQQEGWGAML
ncbi:hypothetical protein N7451_012059 [Penicillium sp. IBT 35674x]|nr:hypothetical protein N7451_012059 [Penicillium sp. IBT 35674x]